MKANNKHKRLPNGTIIQLKHSFNSYVFSYPEWSDTRIALSKGEYGIIVGNPYERMNDIDIANSRQQSNNKDKVNYLREYYLNWYLVLIQTNIHEIRGDQMIVIAKGNE